MVSFAETFAQDQRGQDVDRAGNNRPGHHS
jgi:hypothetical protein